MLFVLINLVYSLSWKCEYPELNGPLYTHFLYKEDNVNEVKWLERFEYCRAKGDTSVYFDAGQGKCEFSRGLCIWSDNTCINSNRPSDPFNECNDLLTFNTLVEGLDNGRLQQPQPQQPQPQQPQQPQPSVEVLPQVLPEPVVEFDRVSSSIKTCANTLLVSMILLCLA